MNTIFMNPKNSKTSDAYILLLSLMGKIDLRQKEKYIDLSNLSIFYTWNAIKKSDPAGHSLYQIFKIIFNIY